MNKDDVLQALWNLADIAILFTSEVGQGWSKSELEKQNRLAREHYKVVREWLDNDDDE